MRPGGRSLTERHERDVVVDEYGHVEVLAQQAAHVDSVPAGHDGRIHGAPGARVDGARQAHADGEQTLGGHPTLGHQAGDESCSVAESHGGVFREPNPLGRARHHARREVEKPDREMSGPDVDGTDHACLRIDAETVRRSAPRRLRCACGSDESCGE